VDTPSKGSEGGLSTRQIIYIASAAGAALLLILVIICCRCLCCGSKKQKKQYASQQYPADYPDQYHMVCPFLCFSENPAVMRWLLSLSL
jgi:hypothetical protein